MAARTRSSRTPRLTASTTLGFLLASVGQRAQGEFRQVLAARGRHPRAFGVLLALDEAGALSQQQLSRRLGVPPSRVVGLVDDLEADGLVTRSTSPADRRVHAVELTEPGRAHLDELLREAQALETRLTAGLDDAEQQQLHDLLGRVASNLGEAEAGALRIW